MIGKTISRYKILAKIWEDSTGSVYRAVDTETDLAVAIRTLGPAIVADAARRQQLERNALTAAGLQHPNIARIYAFSQSGSVEFAVMEAPQGKSASEFLEWERPRRTELLPLATQMARALEAAHSAGITHGPFNPASIFINSKGQVKLYDFGFSFLSPAPDGEEARRSAFGASAPYISPEQVQGVPPDIRSDIFSFGALLYQLTTGRRAFRGETVSEMWSAILRDQPKAVWRQTSRAPRGMGKLIKRCLCKDPQGRFQHFGEIQPLLEKMAYSHNQNPEGEFRPFTRNRKARIAGVALAATVLAAGAAIWSRSGSTGGPSVIGSRILQITKSSGYDTDPSFSGDGSQLAYASDRGGGMLHVWTQPAHGGKPRQITFGPADDHEPAFSPDGETIAFRSERDGGGVYLISTRGGEARLLAAAGRRPRYSPDSRWIAYWVGPPGFAPQLDSAYKVFIIPSGGGAPKQIRPEFASAAYPTWSPDGKNLLFLGWADATRAGPGATEWFVTSVDGSQMNNTGACRTFLSAGALPDGNCGVPGDWKGSHVYFSVPVTGASNIWRADIAPDSLTIAAKPVQVTQGKVREIQPSTSGKGEIAFTRPSYNTDIWGIALNANQGKATAEAKRWTRNPGNDLIPSLTANGALLSFLSDRTGPYGVWLLDMKSGKESPLPSKHPGQLWPVISPDGSKVAYSEERIGKMEQFYTPVGGGATESLCEDCAATVFGWSPDGSFVLVDSFVGERRLAVASIKLASHQKTMLLEDPRYDLSQAHFSPDGRWIVFTARRTGAPARLFVAPFHENAPSPPKEWIALTDGTAWDTAPQFSPDGKLIYFASTRDGYRCVWVQPLKEANKPSGQPFAVSHFHGLRLSPARLPLEDMDLFVASDQILVSLVETTGNIWSAKVSE